MFSEMNFAWNVSRNLGDSNNIYDWWYFLGEVKEKEASVVWVSSRG